MFKNALIIIVFLYHSLDCFCQVGINTVNPTAELEVVTTGNSASTKALSVVNSDGVVLLTVLNNGDIKINSLSNGGNVIADPTGKLLIGSCATVGDIKFSALTSDHEGWIKMDGRTITGLSGTQQANALLLGFAVVLPDATGAVLMQNGNNPGTVSGSMFKTLLQNNLPNINFPSAITSTDGDHTHAHNASGNSGSYGLIRRSTGGQSNTSCCGDTGGSGNEPDLFSTISGLSLSANGNHNHTVTVSSGGSNTPIDITPKSLSANAFIYLGN